MRFEYLFPGPRRAALRYIEIKKPGMTGLDNNCDVYHIYLMIASPNSEQGTCFAPSIKRAKS
jgi:hypothetical protein